MVPLLYLYRQCSLGQSSACSLSVRFFLPITPKPALLTSLFLHTAKSSDAALQQYCLSTCTQSIMIHFKKCRACDVIVRHCSTSASTSTLTCVHAKCTHCTRYTVAMLDTHYVCTLNTLNTVCIHCTHSTTGTEAFPLVVSQLPAALTLYDADLCATVCKPITVSPAPLPAPFLCLTACPTSTGPARFLGGTASGTPF